MHRLSTLLTVAFLVRSMLAVGLSLTVPPIATPLGTAQLVAPEAPG